MTISPSTSSTGGADLAAENAYLRERLTDVAAERDRLSAQLVAAEDYGASLVKLHVANRRLNESVDRGDALEAIREIVISVVGCEEFVILEHDPRSARISLASSFGADVSALADASLRSSVVRSVVDMGTPYYSAPSETAAAGGAAADELSVCVPLLAGSGVVVGAIALYRLLPHRGRLDHNDRMLLELISIEAARALGGRAAAPAAA